MSSKSFFPQHIKCFLSTFTKYLAVITAQFKRRREYSHNSLLKESSCKKQLNTVLNMLPKPQEVTPKFSNKQMGEVHLPHWAVDVCA